MLKPRKEAKVNSKKRKKGVGTADEPIGLNVPVEDSSKLKKAKAKNNRKDKEKSKYFPFKRW